MTLPCLLSVGAVVFATLLAGEDKPQDFRFEFAAVAAGRFKMGVDRDKLKGDVKNIKFLREDEPLRSASVKRPFLIKATEVTWAEWNRVREHAGRLGYTDLAKGRNGYRGDEEGAHPVTEVGWWDAVKWCNLLSELEGRPPMYFSSEKFDKKHVIRSGKPEKIFVAWNSDGYRLPTEAEWEHAWYTAGRAQGHSEPDGWHQDNSEGNTHPVKSRSSASAKDLHDMSGNVAEWCWDWIGPVTSPDCGADPKGPEQGTHRMIRGGSWAEHETCCRGTYRGDFSPRMPRSSWIGFRPVRMKATQR